MLITPDNNHDLPLDRAAARGHFEREDRSVTLLSGAVRYTILIKEKKLEQALLKVMNASAEQVCIHAAPGRV